MQSELHKDIFEEFKEIKSSKEDHTKKALDAIMGGAPVVQAIPEKKKEKTHEAPKIVSKVIPQSISAVLAKPQETPAAPQSKVSSPEKVAGGDEVLNIENTTIGKEKKKKKKNKKRSHEEREGSKKVKFDLSQNKVTEFFKHGKVAQRLLYESK